MEHLLRQNPPRRLPTRCQVQKLWTKAPPYGEALTNTLPVVCDLPFGRGVPWAIGRRLGTLSEDGNGGHQNDKGNGCSRMEINEGREKYGDEPQNFAISPPAQFACQDESLVDRPAGNGSFLRQCQQAESAGPTVADWRAADLPSILRVQAAALAQKSRCQVLAAASVSICSATEV